MPLSNEGYVSSNDALAFDTRIFIYYLRFKKTFTINLHYVSRRFEEPSYTEEQVTDYLKNIAIKELSGNEEAWQETSIGDLDTKYNVLTRCIAEFKRDIPSSQLFYLQTMQDVLNYYQTTPKQPQYIELRPEALPLNMKIVMKSVKKPLSES